MKCPRCGEDDIHGPACSCGDRSTWRATAFRDERHSVRRFVRVSNPIYGAGFCAETDTTGGIRLEAEIGKTTVALTFGPETAKRLAYWLIECAGGPETPDDLLRERNALIDLNISESSFSDPAMQWRVETATAGAEYFATREQAVVRVREVAGLDAD